MIIGDVFKIEFTVDGNDVDLFASGFLKEAKIVERVASVLPTLQLSLGDIAADSAFPSIYDGMPVVITIENIIDGEQHRMPFRVFYYGADPDNETAEVVINCYYDAPDLFKDASFTAIEGRSHEVAKRLADQNRLRFDGDPTSDAQTWIRAGTTGGQFLQHVTERAYKDAKSCYASCVTRMGDLRFYNLTARKAIRSDWLFTQRPSVDADSGSSDVWFTNPIQRSNSGLFNRWRGYGVYASQYNLITGDKEDVYVDELDKSTSHLNMNNNIADPSRFISGPVNCGNTHENYFKAIVQNQQNLALYANDLQLDVSAYKAIRLLDRVDVVHLGDTEETLRQPMNGSYFVDTVVTVATSQEIRSRYNLTREGFTTTQDLPDLF